MRDAVVAARTSWPGRAGDIFLAGAQWRLLYATHQYRVSRKQLSPLWCQDLSCAATQIARPWANADGHAAFCGITVSIDGDSPASQLYKADKYYETRPVK
jgi:hypothetical protein